MQPYYAIKLKCFMLRLMMGSTVLLIAGSIIVAIIQEMTGSYDKASKMAYVFGLLICVLLVALGVLMVYQAFHFEKTVFGHSSRNFALLKQDLEDESTLSAGNLVVTKQFILLFSMHIFSMCEVIRSEDVIACFEDPVYGTVAKPTEYKIYIYDRKFKCHTIVLDAKQSEAGHLAKEKICLERPWICVDNRDVFLDMMITKSGRRNIFKQIEKKKYQMNCTTDVEKEAETELNQLASEAKEKLNFSSILGKVKKDKTDDA